MEDISGDFNIHVWANIIQTTLHSYQIKDLILFTDQTESWLQISRLSLQKGVFPEIAIFQSRVNLVFSGNIFFVFRVKLKFVFVGIVSE